MPDVASLPPIGHLVSDAMSSEMAGRRLKTVRSQLLDMVAGNQFNTARAVDAFATAIHWIVWENIKDRPDRRPLYRAFRRSRLAPRLAEELAATFKREVGAHDQRRPRKLLRFVLGP